MCSETKRPRQQWLDRGRSETLKLVMEVQAQVTFARDACNSSDNKSKLAYL
jgi:hypothetical protein